MACNGGWLNNAWNYLTQTGAVKDSCLPYTSGSGHPPACQNSCRNGEAFHKYKCLPGSVVAATNPEAIKNEIYAHGPMETGFTVYQDFFSYKGGVYRHVSGGQAGGHAVKIIGWGLEGASPYWICANSWGGAWGEKGHFRIAFN
jgi:cathepsin B